MSIEKKSIKTWATLKGLNITQSLLVKRHNKGMDYVFYFKKASPLVGTLVPIFFPSGVDQGMP